MRKRLDEDPSEVTPDDVVVAIGDSDRTAPVAIQARGFEKLLSAYEDR